jgi:gas vesicle protein
MEKIQQRIADRKAALVETNNAVKDIETKFNENVSAMTEQIEPSSEKLREIAKQFQSSEDNLKKKFAASIKGAQNNIINWMQGMETSLKEEINTQIGSLNQGIDAMTEELISKLTQIDANISGKIDESNSGVSQKITETQSSLDAELNSLISRFDQTTGEFLSKSEENRKTQDELLSNISEELKNQILSSTQNFGESEGSFLKENYASITSQITDFGAQTSEILDKYQGNLVTMFSDAKKIAASVVLKMKNRLQTLETETANNLEKATAEYMGKVAENHSAIKSGIDEKLGEATSLIETVKEELKAEVSNIGTAKVKEIEEVSNQTREKLNEVVSLKERDFSKNVEELLSGFSSKLVNQLERLEGSVHSLQEQVSGDLSSALEQISNLVTSINTNINAMFVSELKEVQSVLQNYEEQYTELVTGSIKSFYDDASVVKSNFDSRLSETIQDFGKSMESFMGQLSESLDKYVEKNTTIRENITNEVANILDSNQTSLASQNEELKNETINAVKTTTELMSEIGESSSSGLSGGAEDAIQKVTDEFTKSKETVTQIVEGNNAKTGEAQTALEQKLQELDQNLRTSVENLVKEFQEKYAEGIIENASASTGTVESLGASLKDTISSSISNLKEELEKNKTGMAETASLETSSMKELTQKMAETSEQSFASVKTKVKENLEGTYSGISAQLADQGTRTSSELSEMGEEALTEFRNGMAEVQETVKNLVSSLSAIDNEVKRGGGGVSKSIANLMKALGDAYKSLETAEKEISNIGGR